jgi:hypothetical protein
VIDAGFDIILDDSIRFFHDYDPAKRTKASHTRVRHLGVRNDLLQPWVYFPLDLAIAVTLWRVLSHLMWGFRHHAVLATLRGYLGAVALWPRALGRRAPVRRRSAIKYLALRRRPRVLTGA